MSNSYIFDLKYFRRITQKLSQEEFAKKIGVAKGTIGKIESGHGKLTDSILNRIEAAFDVDLTKYKEAYKSSLAYQLKDFGGIMHSVESSVVDSDRQNRLLDIIDKQRADLEACHREKQHLLERITDLEKQILTTEKTVKAKSGR